MKTPRLLTLLLVFAAMFAGLAPHSTARADASFSFFYDSLDPLGDWLKTDTYGYCWHPDGVDPDWAPYTDGYWAYTDAGWTWVSYEDWGSICYHYGRWVNIEEEGWCWVPDYQWAPAWVSWRHSDRYVGWAPLPPEAHFVEDVGISVWADSTYDIGPSHYNFCEVRDFGAPVLRQVIIPRFRNATFIFNTVNITNISFNRGNHYICNGGPEYSFISGRSSRPVPALKLVQNTNINIVNNNTTIINGNTNRPMRGLQHAMQRGNTLEVFAPSITAPANPLLVKPARVKRVLANGNVNKGWAGVKDPAEREALRGKLREQTAGLTPQTTHAKALPVAEQKIVPEKADPTAASPFSNPKGRPGRKDQDETPGTALVPGNGQGAGRDGKPNVPAVFRNGKRGDQNDAPAVTTPGQDAPVAGEPAGRKPNVPAVFRNGKRGDQNDAPAVTAPGQDAPVAGEPAGRKPNVPAVFKNGKRGEQNDAPAVTAPGQDAPVAGDKKSRGNNEPGVPPTRGERVASPVATAEHQRMQEEQAEKKREKAVASEAKQQKDEAGKEAAKQRHEEQVQERQAVIAKQQSERESMRAAQREREQQSVPERRPSEPPRRQGGFERPPQDRPEEQSRPFNNPAAAAARAAEARQQQQQREMMQRQTPQERPAPQQREIQRQVPQERPFQQPREIRQIPQERPVPQQQRAPQPPPQQQRPQVPQIFQQQPRPQQQEAPSRGRQLTPEEAAAKKDKK